MNKLYILMCIIIKQWNTKLCIKTIQFIYIFIKYHIIRYFISVINCYSIIVSSEKASSCSCILILRHVAVEHTIYAYADITYHETWGTNAYIETNLSLSQRRQFRSDKCALRRSNLRLYLAISIPARVYAHIYQVAKSPKP